MPAAQAQVTAASQTVLKQLPAGITPPRYPGVRRVVGPGARPADRRGQHDAVRHLQPGVQSDPACPGVGPGRGHTGCPTAASRSTSRSISTRPNCWSTACRPPMWAMHWRTQNIVLPAGDQKIGPFDFMVIDQRDADRHRQLQQPADQAGRQRSGLSARCRLRPSRRSAAAEHRAGEGATVHPAADPEDAAMPPRSTVVTGVQAKLPDTAQDPAARRHDHAAQRCLQLRARLDRGRGAGDGDRRSSSPASPF